MRNLAFKLLGFRRAMNLYPPLRGAGIRITEISPDFRTLDVELRLTKSNANTHGSQFGGSLFAMTDPFYPILIKRALGPDCILWDRAASIRYRRPGMTNVYARFHLTEARIDEIRSALDRDGIYDAIFQVEIKDPSGEVIARVERTIYCATKAAHAAKQAARTPRSGPAPHEVVAARD